MPQLVYTASFQKTFKKITKKNPSLKQKIYDALEMLAKNPYSSSLRTHKLTGNLFGLFACTCGYDCRIIFSIEKQKNSKEESILLIDMGTHDEVY